MDFDRLYKSEELKVFSQSGVGQLALTNNLTECPALECTNYLDFTIMMNTDAAEKVVSSLGEIRARKILSSIYGHEFGHYILDYYLVASGTYSSTKEAISKDDPLKHHLTVDAIGMLLTSTHRKNFADVLRQTGTSEIMGKIVPSGDISDRLRCIENLP